LPGEAAEASSTHLRALGYDVVLGDCMSGTRVTSAPAPERGRELTEMLVNLSIAAVVPPWGGELAVEILPHLDLEAIRTAAPTWFVGYSDISTLLLPLTLLTGVATIHGQNFMEAPYRVPAEIRPWYEVAALSAGETIVQSASSWHRSAAAGFDSFAANPEVSDYTLDETGSWQLLNRQSDLQVTGRLVGGCIETSPCSPAPTMGISLRSPVTTPPRTGS